MKAALFEAAGRPLRIEAVAEPRPADDEVLLAIAACGICGSDLHMSADPAHFSIVRGAVLGHEIAGEVIGTGAGVGNLRVGDRVAVAPIRGCGACAPCHAGEPAWCRKMVLIGGGYAERTAVAARQCLRLPEAVPSAEGALAEPTAVALHAVRRARMRPGARVLVLGAGPIGLLVAYWARRLGAGAIVVADLNEAQRTRALAMGATGFARSGARLDQEATALAGGPPDIVFECVGKKGLVDFAIAQVAPRGRVVGVGLCVGGDVWDPFAAIHKEVDIAMSAFFDMHEFAMALDALANEGPFRPQALVTARIGLDALPDAFDAFRNRTTQCKVLVEPYA